MKLHLTILYFFLFTLLVTSQNKTCVAEIYVDKEGIMRWSDSKEEASFFGVNYTTPFAHSYRVMQYKNINHKEAIDRDVYHFARLGFNAYRIHIWDVEITDSNGNVIDNEHLNLLDYLISKLRERNIRILITAMTNFGNGYPEIDFKTGGFSYKYDKCEIHDNPLSLKAQENYISQLISHVNPYTGVAYKKDPYIIGFEINNEPCHAGNQAQTKNYINRMLAAIHKAGNKKPVFYNVSHNLQQTEVYYSSDIQGTTYQWYPIGLVAGHTRKGNFLPNVDSFNIPFSNVNGFGNKAKLIYEYDPADIMYSYMHPAMVRSFRSAGFQWITQFAYDPIDIAQYNTEYQTHYLNLAYTPQKAISMKIAAEAAQKIKRNQRFVKYPNDTVFGNFRVSYKHDLSELNSVDKFYYSNNTTTVPVDVYRLTSVVGFGNSPVIQYKGRGAYFLDCLEDGVWRLEIMPDAIQVNDPFAKPSLSRKAVVAVNNKWDMKISLPQLQNNFEVTAINNGNLYKGQAENGIIHAIAPGVYLLRSKNSNSSKQWDSNTVWTNFKLGEYVSPKLDISQFYVYHNPSKVTEKGKPLKIEANIVGPSFPDSILIYTDKVSFWNKNNKYVKMTRTEGYTYKVQIPESLLKKGKFKYQFVVYFQNRQFTFPGAEETSPLAWDYDNTLANYWGTEVVDANSDVKLTSISDEYSNINAYCVPEKGKIFREFVDTSVIEKPIIRFTCQTWDSPSRIFLRKYVKELITCRSNLGKLKDICVRITNIPDSAFVGFISDMGYTYSAAIEDYMVHDGVVRIPISQLKSGKTALLPNAYPSFMATYFEPQTQISFSLKNMESIEISFNMTSNDKIMTELGAIWIE